MTPCAACDCTTAQDYLQMLSEDPMTTESSCGDEIAEAWLRKHILVCPECAEATIEGNMP